MVTTHIKPGDLGQNHQPPQAQAAAAWRTSRWLSSMPLPAPEALLVKLSEAQPRGFCETDSGPSLRERDMSTPTGRPTAGLVWATAPFPGTHLHQGFWKSAMPRMPVRGDTAAIFVVTWVAGWMTASVPRWLSGPAWLLHSWDCCVLFDRTGEGEGQGSG